MKKVPYSLNSSQLSREAVSRGVIAPFATRHSISILALLNSSVKFARIGKKYQIIGLLQHRTCILITVLAPASRYICFACALSLPVRVLSRILIEFDRSIDVDRAEIPQLWGYVSLHVRKSPKLRNLKTLAFSVGTKTRRCFTRVFFI